MAKFFRGFSMLLSVLSLIFALAEAEKPCDTPFCNQVALEIEQAINKSVDPCTDFYEFTCGGWKANHQIPDDRSRYGQFDELNKKMQKQIETALKTGQKPKANSTDYSRKLYDTCYAYDSKPSLGRTEVQDFAQNYMNNVIGFENIINHIQVPWYKILVKSILFCDVSGFFDIGIQPDPKNVTKNIITMDSVGFTLGDNELKNLTANAHIVEAYRQLLEKIQMFFGQKNDTKLQSEANNIINLESELAKVMMSTEERRNPEALYNKMTLKQFSEKTGFDWFAKIVEPLVTGSHVDYKLSNSTEIIIGDVNYFVKAIKILENLSMETYYDYFGMRSVLKFGMFASNEIRQYLFEFNQVRMGVKKQAELWQICLALANDQLSVALSRLFVDTQFNEMQKKSATKVIEKIQNSYENLVKENDWLDAETKNKSLNKLKMVRTNVAYPEWLLDDAKLDDYYGLHDNDLYKRMMAESNFLIGLAMFRANRVQKEIQELYNPIDKDLKWPMPAAIINAAYDPTQNSITIPAGILKSPFFDSRRPFSMNYGAIGVVIGHELTHGLDDEGRQFDAVGNLHSWWNNKSIEQFKNRSECFVKQYGDQLIKEINMHINGRLTLGENIADNGGIHEAYRAFKNADAESASPKLAKLPQYSSDQLFFISFAQVWCGKSRPETLRLQVEYDPHSPMKYRVNVPLSNSADFARTFNCSKGSPMNPTDKCLLW